MSTPAISDNDKPTTLNIFHNLQEANDKLDAVIENSFDGIYITDGRRQYNQGQQGLRADHRPETFRGHGLQYARSDETEHHFRVRFPAGHSEAAPGHLHQQFKTGKKALITSSLFLIRKIISPWSSPTFVI